MTLTFDQLKQIVIALETMRLEQERLIDEVPGYLKSFLFDTPYISETQKALETTLKVCLGKELFEDIQYFLYEPRDHALIRVNEVSYTVSSLKEYLHYLEQIYFSENQKK